MKFDLDFWFALTMTVAGFAVFMAAWMWTAFHHPEWIFCGVLIALGYAVCLVMYTVAQDIANWLRK